MIVITKEDGYTVVTDTSEDEIQILKDRVDNIEELDFVENGETYVFDRILGCGYNVTAGQCFILFDLPVKFDSSKQEVDEITLANCFLRGDEGVLRLNGSTATINNVTLSNDAYSVRYQTSPVVNNILAIEIPALDPDFRYHVQAPVNMLTKMTVKFKEKTESEG